MEYIQQLFNNVYTNYLAAIVILLVVFVVAPWIVRGVLTVAGVRGKAKNSKLYVPLKFMFYIAGIYVALVYCDLPSNIFAIARKVVRIGFICLATIAIIRFIDSKTAKKMESNIKKGRTLLSFTGKIIKVILIVVAVLFIILELGYNPTGILASLGIGGAIIALAAQDIGKNIIGGGTVVTDKPFSIGDWIEVDNIAGTVIDLNMRSTKLKAFDGSLVVIPNSTFLTSSVVNWTKIEDRRYKFNVLVILNSPMNKIEYFIEDAYAKLNALPTVVEDSVNISFNIIEDSGYNILIYLDTTNILYKDYIKFQELVNYTVVQLLEKHKLVLAYPTQTIQMM